MDMDDFSQPQVLPEPTASTDALERATQLSGRARRSTRWYGSYLLVFAAGSFAVSVLTGAVPGPRGTLTVMLLWAAFLAVTTIWIARQKTSIRGMTRLHLAVILSWAVLWGITVTVGEHYFADQLWWWVAGGLAIALPPVVGAVVTFRRTA